MKAKCKMRNVKLHTTSSNIANYAWTHNHNINFENRHIIENENYRTGRTLEYWHTAKTIQAHNNSKPLPGRYAILLQK